MKIFAIVFTTIFLTSSGVFAGSFGYWGWKGGGGVYQHYNKMKALTPDRKPESQPVPQTKQQPTQQQNKIKPEPQNPTQEAEKKIEIEH